jgi:hypothetical protein
MVASFMVGLVLFCQFGGRRVQNANLADYETLCRRCHAAAPPAQADES